MKTTQLLVTTTPYYQYINASGYGYNDTRQWFTDDETFRNYELKIHTPVIIALSKIYDIAIFLNFFVNIIHLFILAQKELRTNLVYIIMIGICLCDMILSIGKMAQMIMTWQIIYKNEQCYVAYFYYHVLTNVLSKCGQIFSRRCSGILALFIAGFRAFSVLFPMSNAVNFLMKAKSGYFIVLLTMVICGLWGFEYFRSTKIQRLSMCPAGDTPSYVMYIQNTQGTDEATFRLFDGYITVVISVLYVLLAIILMVALTLAKKRRRNLGNEKSSNTSAFVIVMSITVFWSEFAYGFLFIMTVRVLSGREEKKSIEEFEFLPFILSIVSSIVHCIICFLMSLQYRDTVKRVVRWKDKEKQMRPEPSTLPTVVSGTITSKTFGK